MKRSLNSLLTDLLEVDDQGDLVSRVDRYLTRQGFEGFMFTPYQHGGEEFTWLCSCGGDLLQRYFKKEFHLVDPVSSKVRRNRLPVPWDAYQYRSACRGTRAQLFEDTLDCGFKRGISVPIHGPSGAFDVFVGLFNHSREEFARRQTELCYDLLLIGAYVSAAYHASLHRDEVERPALTDRELECLHWTAQGKTAWEVSRILGISVATVNYHIRNVSQKLETGSKYQAVLKASKLGLIDP